MKLPSIIAGIRDLVFKNSTKSKKIKIYVNVYDICCVLTVVVVNFASVFLNCAFSTHNGAI